MEILEFSNDSRLKEFDLKLKYSELEKKSVEKIIEAFFDDKEIFPMTSDEIDKIQGEDEEDDVFGKCEEDCNEKYDVIGKFEDNLEDFVNIIKDYRDNVVNNLVNQIEEYFNLSKDSKKSEKKHMAIKDNKRKK